MKMMKNKSCILLLLASCLLVLLTSCYGDHPQQEERHYGVNYNFVVKADSISLLRQEPEELMSELPTDTFAVKKDAQLVVADIRALENDPVDSIWVQVATEESEFGWIHESLLLPAVVPDDPISQFISFFSDTHILFSLFFVVVIGFAYSLRSLLRRQSYIVHINDVDSFYPTLLTLVVAFAATFYASIQMFAPDVWRHFYYNPTLNPFAVPLLLAVFLFSVWSMFIVALAAADDVRKLLLPGEALLYLVSLMGVCAVDYIIFSITTLYYIGYLLLVAYTLFCLRSYNVRHRRRYICGHCGKKIRNKGRCPYCGVENL